LSVALETTAERWAVLEPHVRVHGPPDDRPRPAVLLFHGCGGMRPHLAEYAEAAAAAGLRAFVIDSFAPRRWPKAYTRFLVCTGMRFWGRERAGDVLAATWGVSRRADVDASRLVFAGWSHGGWAIMDLMTMSLADPGGAGLANPDPAPLDGLRGLFLAYPYGGYGALSRRRRWLRAVPTLAVLPELDHVTSARDARTLFAAVGGVCADLELWEVKGATHSFDELTGVFPMRYDSELSALSLARFRAFLERSLA
jgi:dienelactone hydrolase